MLKFDKKFFGMFVVLLVSFLFFSCSILKEKETGTQKSLDTNSKKELSFVGGDEFNYAFKLDANFETKADLESHSGALILTDGQIYSSKDAFKQRLKIGEFKTSIDGKKETIVKDLDFVSDMFKVYYKYSSKLLNKDLTKIPEPSENYKMIDNEKIILNILGDLAKNEVIKELVLSNMTSNSLTYLEKHKTLEKLKKELQNDKFLDYLFVKNGEPKQEDGKTRQDLVFADEVCDDLLPVFSNIYEAGVSKNGLGNSKNPFKDTETCKNYINQANGTIQVGAQVYKKGDLKNGNYDFIISLGAIFNTKIIYKNHNLSYWDIDFKYSTIASVNINGDNSGVKDSNMKVDFTDDNFSIKGEIKNGNGELILDLKSKDGVEGRIVMKDYFAEKIDLNILEDDKNIGSLNGYLKEKDGNLKLVIDYNGGKFNLEGKYGEKYLKITFNIDVDGEKSNGILEIKDDSLEINFNSEKAKISGIFDDEKVNFSMVAPGVKLTLNGNYKNYKDFKFDGKLELDSSDDNLDFGLSAKEENEKVYYKLNLKNTEKNYLKVDGILIEGKKDDFNLYNFNLKSEFSDNGKKINFIGEANYYYKEGGVKFEIPKDYEEIGDSILDSFVMPALNPNVLEKQYKVVGKNVVKIYVGIFAGVGIGTAIMVPQLTLAQDRARDAGKLSNVNMLFSKITLLKVKDSNNTYSSIAKNITPANEDGVITGDVNLTKIGELNFNENDYKIQYVEKDGEEECFLVAAKSSQTGKYDLVRGNCVGNYDGLYPEE